MYARLFCNNFVKKDSNYTRKPSKPKTNLNLWTELLRKVIISRLAKSLLIQAEEGQGS